jgi:tetratricopeptide (TPR) repeat protein
MTMKRILLIAAATLATFGCAELAQRFDRDTNAYENPFYAKYLNTGAPVDGQITRTLDALRKNPDSPELHNRLGSLLVQKGFPKDAEVEFERAVNADGGFYPAWYNLGLVRSSRGDELGARRAFSRAVANKPGHAAALFQLGLIEEKRYNTDKAVKLYAKAFGINPSLMDVDVNPRIVDTKLIHLALLEMYPTAHHRQSMQFQGTPTGYRAPATAKTPPDAPSKVPAPSQIITPAPPPTDPSQQKAPPATST